MSGDDSARTGVAQDTGAIFGEIRAADIVLHHPYLDFAYPRPTHTYRLEI